MKFLVELIRSNTDWLYFKLYENSYFFIDFWSFMHFFSGLLLLLFIDLLQIRKKWIVLFVFLFSYEFVEISIRYIALNVFRPETIKDQFTDIFIGMLGGLVASFLIRNMLQKQEKESQEKIKENTVIIFVAFLISFLWVGFYGYRYNYEFLNSNGMNYTAFLLWWVGIMILGKTYFGVKSKINSHAKRFLFSWGIYFAGLCLIEYIFYHILGLKEIGASEHKAMFFDIIHGTKILHIYYLTVPFISIFFFEIILKMIQKILTVKMWSSSRNNIKR